MLKIGHRGACGSEPENTLSSFQKALDIGVDMVELDVYVCASGELVVFHDHYLGRVTDGHGYIERKILKELKELKVRGKDKIPTLKEVLDLVNRKVKVNIELKGKNTAMPVCQLIGRYLKIGWREEDFLISSFRIEELYEFRKFNSTIRIGLLFDMRIPNLDKYFNDLEPYSIHLNKHLAKKEIINKLHHQGLKVFLYTVNERVEIQQFKNIGVDGLFSDYPDRL